MNKPTEPQRNTPEPLEGLLQEAVRAIRTTAPPAGFGARLLAEASSWKHQPAPRPPRAAPSSRSPLIMLLGASIAASIFFLWFTGAPHPTRSEVAKGPLDSTARLEADSRKRSVQLQSAQKEGEVRELDRAKVNALHDLADPDPIVANLSEANRPEDSPAQPYRAKLEQMQDLSTTPENESLDALRLQKEDAFKKSKSLSGGESKTQDFDRAEEAESSAGRFARSPAFDIPAAPADKDRMPQDPKSSEMRSLDKTSWELKPSELKPSEPKSSELKSSEEKSSEKMLSENKPAPADFGSHISGDPAAKSKRAEALHEEASRPALPGSAGGARGGFGGGAERSAARGAARGLGRDDSGAMPGIGGPGGPPLKPSPDGLESKAKERRSGKENESKQDNEASKWLMDEESFGQVRPAAPKPGKMSDARGKDAAAEDAPAKAEAERPTGEGASARPDVSMPRTTGNDLLNPTPLAVNEPEELRRDWLESYFFKSSGAMPTRRVAVALNATRLFTTGDTTLVQWGDVNTHTRVNLLHGLDWSKEESTKSEIVGEIGPGPFAVTPDGKTVLNSNGVVLQVDEKKIARMEEFGTDIAALVVSPNGDKLVAQHVDDQYICYCRISDLPSGKKRFDIPHQWGYTFAAGFSPDHSAIALMDKDKKINELSLGDGNVIKSYAPPHLNSIRAIEYSPNGKLLASTGTRGETYLWDRESAKLLHQLQIAQTPEVHAKQGLTALRFSPDSRFLAASGTSNLFFWNLQSGAVAAQLEPGSGGAIHLRYSADGKKITAVTGFVGAKTKEGKEGLKYPTVKEWEVPAGAR